MRDKFLSDSNERKEILTQQGILIDFPSPVHYHGKSVWALGSRLYHSEAPNISFHEFLFSALAQELGNKWIKDQENLPIEERHFILKCHTAYVAWRNANTKDDNKQLNGTWAATPDGLTKSLLSLAFDVACIIHVHEGVPKQIIERLKLSDNNYQGARYEIAVAAIFARMGCKLEFLDEILSNLKQTPGHCEFYATDPDTGITVAVEAKSKVRKGVLHEVGTSTEFQLWNNVTGPYRRALKQNPDVLPFVICVDVNSPPSPGVNAFDKVWAKEILKSRKDNSTNKPDNPDPCSAIVYTNYSYHYQTDQEAKSNEAIIVFPEYPKFVLPEHYLKKLANTVNEYSFSPNLGYDGRVQM
jgi:hypothetical protein